MASMAHLWQRDPALRRAAPAQGALSIAFSAFLVDAGGDALRTLSHGQRRSGERFRFAAGSAGRALPAGLADKFGAGKVTQMGAALVTSPLP